MPVEAGHELGGGPIVDSPQGRDDATGPGVLESAGQADEPLAALLLTEGRFAGRENDQVGVEPQSLENLPCLEEAVLAVFAVFLRDGESQE